VGRPRHRLPEQRLLPRLNNALADSEIEQARGPAYAIDEDSGDPAPVRVTCAVPVPEGALIDRDGPRDTWVVELQIALQPG